MRCVRLYLPLEFYRAPPITVRSAPRNLKGPSCQLNRAVLLYEPRSGDGSVFRIVFSDPQRWEE
jgi:hypothetical protein